MAVERQQQIQLMTIRDAARRLGVRVHQLNYAIEQYPVEPTQRAGIIRLFAADRLPAMRSALLRVAERRTGV